MAETVFTSQSQALRALFGGYVFDLSGGKYSLKSLTDSGRQNIKLTFAKVDPKDRDVFLPGTEVELQKMSKDVWTKFLVPHTEKGNRWEIDPDVDSDEVELELQKYMPHMPLGEETSDHKPLEGFVGLDPDLVLKSKNDIVKAIREGHELMYLQQVIGDKDSSLKFVGEILKLASDGSIEPAERLEITQRATDIMKEDEQRADETVDEWQERLKTTYFQRIEKVRNIARDVMAKKAASLRRGPTKHIGKLDVKIASRRSRLRRVLKKFK